MSKLVDLATREIVRMEIMEICQQSIPVGADEKVVRTALRRSGYDISEEEVAKQLYYLEGKKLLELQKVENRVLGIERVIARITPEGMDCLEGSVEAGD